MKKQHPIPFECGWKKFLPLTLFFSLLATCLPAQKTIWLDGDLNETKKKHSEFYAISLKTDSGYYIATYQLTNDKPYRQGLYITEMPEKNKQNGYCVHYTLEGKKELEGTFRSGKKEGNWVFYYPDGTKKSEGAYLNDKEEGLWNFYEEGKHSKGTYLKGKKEGEWIWYHANNTIAEKGNYLADSATGPWFSYYESGKKEDEKFYTDNKLTGAYTTWFEDGSLEKRAFYKSGLSDSLYVSYYEKDLVSDSGNYIMDRMDGLWKFYHRNGKIASLETWKSGVPLEVHFWTENGEAMNGIDTSHIMIMPEFTGGERAMYDFLYQQIKYPSRAKESGIQGKIIVRFIVETDGSISGVQVKKRRGYGLDEESMNAVKKLPHFKPGMAHNRKARVYYELPVIFRLN